MEVGRERGAWTVERLITAILSTRDWAFMRTISGRLATPELIEAFQVYAPTDVCRRAWQCLFFLDFGN